MSGYTPTTWANAVTAADQTNMNHIENGIANCLYNDGSSTTTVTLSGTNKVLANFVATDGINYQFIETAAGQFLIYDNTNGKQVLGGNLGGGTSTDVGIWAPLTAGRASIGASTLTFIRVNNHTDNTGTTDKFDQTGGTAYQATLDSNGLRCRKSTNSPVAGTVINWSAFTVLYV